MMEKLLTPGGDIDADTDFGSSRKAGSCRTN